MIFPLMDIELETMLILTGLIYQNQKGKNTIEK